MKKLLAFLLSVCMVSAFAVPAFADANSDYIAAVKAYQAQVAAKEAAYTAAVQAAAQQAQAFSNCVNMPLPPPARLLRPLPISVRLHTPVL